MISSLKTHLPRFHENLRYVVLTGVVEVADGQLASFTIPNNSFDVVAEFTKTSPRSTSGHVRIVDGLANVVLDIPSAAIQIEQGAADPSWPGPTLGAVTISGADNGGRVWLGRSTGVDAEDPTSIGFEFSISSANGLMKQLQELSTLPPAQ